MNAIEIELTIEETAAQFSGRLTATSTDGREITLDVQFPSDKLCREFARTLPINMDWDRHPNGCIQVNVSL